MSSCNFIKVRIEPVNDTEPIKTVNTIAVITAIGSSDLAVRNSITETTAAAPPPTPLNRATICGI